MYNFLCQDLTLTELTIHNPSTIQPEGNTTINIEYNSEGQILFKAKASSNIGFSMLVKRPAAGDQPATNILEIKGSVEGVLKKENGDLEEDTRLTEIQELEIIREVAKFVFTQLSMFTKQLVPLFKSLEIRIPAEIF